MKYQEMQTESSILIFPQTGKNEMSNDIKVQKGCKETTLGIHLSVSTKIENVHTLCPRIFHLDVYTLNPHPDNT